MPERTRPDPGFFGPESMSWRINREAVLLLGGPRALLLQLAHPLVAAAVAERSDFLRDPVGRLRRTLDLTLGIVFGDEAAARARVRRIRGVHARVRGVLSEGTRAFPTGTRYDALDPTLLFWVHATLVDSALVTYRRFVGRLSRAECARYYEESRRLAGLFQIPDAHVPPDLPAFERYWRAALQGPTLEVTPTARRLADAVLHPPVRGVPRVLGDVASVVTLGLLPATIRRRYGLPWAPRHRRGWRLARGLVRLALPGLPDRLRTMPHARRAQTRIADAPRTRPR